MENTTCGTWGRVGGGAADQDVRGGDGGEGDGMGWVSRIPAGPKEVGRSEIVNQSPNIQERRLRPG